MDCKTDWFRAYDYFIVEEQVWVEAGLTCVLDGYDFKSICLWLKWGCFKALV